MENKICFSLMHAIKENMKNYFTIHKLKWVYLIDNKKFSQISKNDAVIKS